MKNRFLARSVHILGLIVLITVAGFSFTACEASDEVAYLAVEEGGGFRVVGLLFIVGLVLLVFGFMTIKEGNGQAGFIMVVLGIGGIIFGFRALFAVVASFFRGLFGG